MNLNFAIAIVVLSAQFCACKIDSSNAEKKEDMIVREAGDPIEKKVIYQVFTRLFGNKNTTNIPWGTIEDNGVGKFNDFTDRALSEIKALGVTHIWYTGVPHHAVIRDYESFGISNDDPDIVKGRAGSPFAVKDYYNVNPDLAINPAERLREFEELIARTHESDMKVIIDIVPNHVARKYEGKNNPTGIQDFGALDNKTVAYARDNNFYYNIGSSFEVPEWRNGYLPLGGESHSLCDGIFDENPAKWTGNGSRKAQPDINDWYETVKVNYGVKPDGTKDFAGLPIEYHGKTIGEHYDFWSDKDVPDSWIKFKDITYYWLDKGVDGFRFDMAEMVPVEFWSFLNSSIKLKNPEAFILAEVYNPSLYRDYIHLGKMDYLYDKVQLYDTLKTIIQGHGSTDHIPPILDDLSDIEHHMLHFLENHDEQRIASPEFAGLAEKGKPAMVVSTLVSTSPTMIYFGQEVGESGAEDAGFGKPSRTSIFDYIGVPHHQRWMNDGAFDGGQSTQSEKELRDFYKRLLNFSLKSEALEGEFYDLHRFNRISTDNYNDKIYSFARWNENEKIIVITNFDSENEYDFEFRLPEDLINLLKLEDKIYVLDELLYQKRTLELLVKEGSGRALIILKPLQSFVFKVNE